ncbi:MAG: DUF2029 domain-containing protein [Candidatus Micrarchaeota archaeon]|nr:DUF2029 domain-containing protein [Candidatus Micrarchaeota archaeon]
MDRPFFLQILVISIALAALLLVYIVNGPSWDLIVHYLNARSMMSGQFLSRHYAVWGYIIQDNTFYIETLRAGMQNVLLMPLVAAFGRSLLPYVIALYLLYIASISYIARALEMDRLIMYALFLNPYFIYTSFVFSSEEILSLAFMLFAIGMLARRSPLAGLFIGFSSLSKYTALAFVPLLLALGRPRRIAYGFLLFAVALSPWLLFNYYFFGNPLQSYEQSISLNIYGAMPFTVYPLSIATVLSVPAIFMVASGWLSKGKTLKALAKKARSVDHQTLVAILLTLLSIAGYAYVAFGHGAPDQARYGYAVTASMLLLVALSLKGSSIRRMRMAIASISIVLLAVFIVGYAAFAYSTNILQHNVDLKGSAMGSAVDSLNSSGYGNCRVVSNSWVYLLYDGVKAYNPFYNDNATEPRYPIAALSQGSGVPISDIQNLQGSTTVYSDANISILLPQDWICVT